VELQPLAGKQIVVDDVSKDPRYLACSLETKSEIVVPVFVKGDMSQANSISIATSQPHSELRTRNSSSSAPRLWGKGSRSPSES
jgi:hypothetical protein